MGATQPIDHSIDLSHNPAKSGKDSAIGSTKDPPGPHTSQPGHLHTSPSSDSPYHGLECNLMEALCKFSNDVVEALEKLRCAMMKALEARGGKSLILL